MKAMSGFNSEAGQPYNFPRRDPEFDRFRLLSSQRLGSYPKRKYGFDYWAKAVFLLKHNAHKPVSGFAANKR